MPKDLRRAFAMAAIVGTALSLIHGQALFAGGGTAVCDWRLYANFAVPFLVSLISSRLARKNV